MESESLLSGFVSMITNIRVSRSITTKKMHIRSSAERIMEVSLQKDVVFRSITQLMKGVPVQVW